MGWILGMLLTGGWCLVVLLFLQWVRRIVRESDELVETYDASTADMLLWQWLQTHGTREEIPPPSVMIIDLTKDSLEQMDSTLRQVRGKL